MTPPRILEQRVGNGCAFLDLLYVEHAWRVEALQAAIGRRAALWACAQEIAHAGGAGGSHEWHLERGFTIDYSSLGYPEGDAGPSRSARERRAYAELEAAWWGALVRC